MTQKLAARLRDLNRRIYASLPFGYRLAQVVLHMASSLTDTIGKAFYAEFLKAGVEDMPDIDGQPALSVADKYVKNPQRLPRGYGAKFGTRVYATLLQKVRNPEVVEELVSMLLENLANDRFSSGLSKAISLPFAERYVLTSLPNLVTDYLRKEYGRGDKIRQKDLSLDTPIGESSTIEDLLSDPQAFKSLDNMLSHSELTRMTAELDRLNPRAAEWFTAKLNGDKAKDIAESWGVSPAAISQFESKIIPKVKEVLYKYLDVAA